MRAFKGVLVNENKEERPGFFRSALTLSGSATPRIFFRLLGFGAYAVTITLIHKYFFELPTYNLTPFEIFGAFLGIILVFRTNAGHERWWEARKIWGGIVNQCRNLVVAALSYVPKNDKQLKKFVGLVVSFPYSAKSWLRQNDQPKLQLNNQIHEPSAICLQLGKILHHWHQEKIISDFAFYTMDNERKKLIDYIGACERILKTPMPLVYAIKVRRFLLLFLGLAPLALVATAGFNTPLIILLVAYPLLGLDQIGKELQNPFSQNNLSHLPLDTICKTIEKDSFGLLSFEQQIADKKSSPRDFVQAGAGEIQQ